MEVPLDPWSRGYAYVLNGDSAPEVLSYGADGKPGGELFDADISTSNLGRTIPESRRLARQTLEFRVAPALLRAALN